MPATANHIQDDPRKGAAIPSQEREGYSSGICLIVLFPWLVPLVRIAPIFGVERSQVFLDSFTCSIWFSKFHPTHAERHHCSLQTAVAQQINSSFDSNSTNLIKKPIGQFSFKISLIDAIRESPLPALMQHNRLSKIAAFTAKRSSRSELIKFEPRRDTSLQSLQSIDKSLTIRHRSGLLRHPEYHMYCIQQFLDARFRRVSDLERLQDFRIDAAVIALCGFFNPSLEISRYPQSKVWIVFHHDAMCVISRLTAMTHCALTLMTHYASKERG